MHRPPSSNARKAPSQEIYPHSIPCHSVPEAAFDAADTVALIALTSEDPSLCLTGEQRRLILPVLEDVISYTGIDRCWREAALDLPATVSKPFFEFL